MATATIPMTPATDARKGFGDLPCPKCGEPGCITLRLDSFDEDDSLKCCNCDGEYPLSDVRDFIAVWGKVLAWIDSRPA